MNAKEIFSIIGSAFFLFQFGEISGTAQDIPDAHGEPVYTYPSSGGGGANIPSGPSPEERARQQREAEAQREREAKQAQVATLIDRAVEFSGVYEDFNYAIQCLETAQKLDPGNKRIAALLERARNNLKRQQDAWIAKQNQERANELRQVVEGIREDRPANPPLLASSDSGALGQARSGNAQGQDAKQLLDASGNALGGLSGEIIRGTRPPDRTGFFGEQVEVIGNDSLNTPGAIAHRTASKPWDSAGPAGDTKLAVSVGNDATGEDTWNNIPPAVKNDPQFQEFYKDMQEQIKYQQIVRSKIKQIDDVISAAAPGDLKNLTEQKKNLQAEDSQLGQVITSDKVNIDEIYIEKIRIRKPGQPSVPPPPSN